MADIWEETKRLSQRVYHAAGQSFDHMYASIGNAYQQLLVAGHLYPSMERSVYNYEIAQNAHRDLDIETPEAEKSLEPER